jgi:uncharacterized protein YqgC (DUF456 family)
MGKQIVAVVLSFLFFGFTFIGHAQESPESLFDYKGLYVTIRLKDGGGLEGHVIDSDEYTHTIFWRSGGGEVVIPRDNIEEIKTLDKPPLKGTRIAWEIFAGSGIGIPAFLATGFFGFIILYNYEYNNAIWKAYAPVCLGVLTVGSATGVYLVGNAGNENGSLLATLCGSVIGLLVGLHAIEQRSSSLDVWDLLILTGPSIAATTAFNLTRRYDQMPKTAMINYSNGQISLAVPRVSFRSDSFGRGDLSQSVNLLRIGF